MTLVAAVALVSGACTFDDIGRRDESRSLGRITLAGSLQAFDACEDFLAEVKAQAKDQVGPYGLGYGYGYGGGGPVPDFAMAQRGSAGLAAGGADGGATGDVAVAAPAPEAGKDFSETNVQEKGVDEPDIVKTNGELIVIASGGILRVIEPGDEPKQIGMVDVPGVGGDQILMTDDRVLVFGGGHEVVASHRILPYAAPRTTVTAVSIEDPSEPRVLTTKTVDGSFVNARLLDGTARLVVQSGSPQIAWVQPSGLPTHTAAEYQENESAATAQNRQLLEASTAEQWLPSVAEDESDTRPLVDCERIHHPEEPAGTALTTVVSVDRDGNLGEAVSVLANAGTVYASGSALYVATMNFAAFAADSRVAAESFDTQIHRFDISDPERAYYVGSGKVPGHLLNQFSLSEHDGNLRVATTKGFPGGSGTESLVTVLAPEAGQLVQIGQVGGLGKDERIYSVRFIGDMGYVVTFRQTDPLYVVDLSDPAAPAVRGELKINGYSAYLHPISDTLLLGVGQDATDQGMRLGMQLSLFDVSDPASPKRLHQATIRNTQTEAEWDHHAFLYWAPTKLTVVPLFDYQVGGLAAGFSVDAESGIDEIARIQHASAGDPHLGQIRRSLVIGERLYTLSEGALHASDLKTLANTGAVTF